MSMNYMAGTIFTENSSSIEESVTSEILDSFDNKYRPPLVVSGSSAIDEQDKSAKRAIAPYVTLVQKGAKATLLRDDTYYSFFTTKKSYLLIKSLKSYISTKKDLPRLLYETADVMKDLTDSLGFRLYLVDREHKQLYLYQKHVAYERCRVSFNLDTCESLACYVARTQEYVMVEDVTADARFKDGISYKENVKAVLCVPIVTQYNTFAVIELYKNLQKPAYEKKDLKLAVMLSGWIGLTVQENYEGYMFHMKETISNNLLQMVQTCFHDSTTLELLLSGLISYAKKEILADKATVYVITDLQNMIADVYAEGISDESKSLIKKKVAVSFGTQNTVACLVAREKRLINVKDLRSDERFTSQTYVDGFLMIIERTELCVPVMINGTLLGIISIVNKADNAIFTPEDEEIIQIIASYLALALSFHRSHVEIKKAKLECESLSELLQFQLTPSQLDVANLKQYLEFPLPQNINAFNYYVDSKHLHWMPQMFIKMLQNVVPHDEINNDELYLFVLAVRNSYRNNPYHNFEHAFIVTQSIYAILMRNLKTFSITERAALMIAAFGHDIDHGGVTNNFLLITKHYLSNLYESSIWEQHHCFVLAQILKKFHIFKHVAIDLELFKQQVFENILYTDLSDYFRKRNQLLKILNRQSFNMDIPDHKELLRSVCMTVSDLAGQGKPFSVTKRFTDALYREFYAQGDREKALGFTPLTSMDRNSEAQIPDDQAHFVSIVVLSSADLLRSLLPNTAEIYLNAQLLRNTWCRIIDSRGDKLWRQCDSVVS